MKKLLVLITILCNTQIFAGADYSKLLISEIVVTPTAAEFIEIYNSGPDTLDLSNVYITDATGNGNFYYNITTGLNYGGGGSSDFHARFPNNASIAANEYQTIAINATNFTSEFGVQPHYELNESNDTTNMLEAVSGSINNQGGLSNGGEFLVLYYWDGVSNLVQDIDYIVWGDQNEAVDKSGVMIGGETYLNDTPIMNQSVIASGAHTFGQSWQRTDLTESTETKVAGNGISGHDETSENTASAFSEGIPTPAENTVPQIEQFIINEIDAVSNGGDFIELFGQPNTSTTGYTIVLYDGLTDEITTIVSLDGMSTNANGYLLINQDLEDGADAMALYAADSINFTVGGGITTTDIMDAIVYDSGQADDVELLTLLNPGQPQINEDANGAAMSESLIRCTNGSGGQLNTTSFKAFTPSPNLPNEDCISITDYYATANDTNAETLRLTLHQIIDDHIAYPYTSGSTDTWDVLSFADEDPNPAVDLDPSVSEKVWMIYKNNSYETETGGNSNYNREHTWPQTFGFSSGALGSNNTARTDAHHLMLSDINYNSDRDSNFFNYCDPSNNPACIELPTDNYNGEGGGAGIYPGNSNWYTDDNDGNEANDFFEVWNFRKGDIARAMFYMDVRYDDLAADPSGIPGGEVDLTLTDDASLIVPNAPYMGLLSVLIEWHEFDPVDDIERKRNEEVFALQENRNPFIDHPEWVECIFVQGGECTTTSDDLIFADGFE